MSPYLQLWLTCKDKNEADKIATVLLEGRLVACVKYISIGSAAWWKGKIENTREILMMMESRQDLFERVEREVEKLHSYDTPVLTASAINKISKKAAAWLEGELKK